MIGIVAQYVMMAYSSSCHLFSSSASLPMTVAALLVTIIIPTRIKAVVHSTTQVTVLYHDNTLVKYSKLGPPGPEVNKEAPASNRFEFLFFVSRVFRGGGNTQVLSSSTRCPASFLRSRHFAKGWRRCETRGSM